MNDHLNLLQLPEHVKMAKSVTLGVFDGVHRGHQEILKKLSELDPENALVITFSSHPDRILWNRKVKWIDTHQDRLKCLKRYGAKHIVEFEFTPELAGISAHDFAQELFIHQLHQPHVVMGHDLRFGHQAKGSYDFLKSYFSDLLQLSQVAPVLYESRPISSTRLREAVLRGEFRRIHDMLGRDFRSCGRVIQGYQRGRQLGFPTANVALQDDLILPPFGVYAVELHHQGTVYSGVANLGLRPTFEEIDAPQLEVHVLGFEGDLYGQEIEIDWKRFIRSEKKFPDRNALIQQIKSDIDEAFHGS